VDVAQEGAAARSGRVALWQRPVSPVALLLCATVLLAALTFALLPSPLPAASSRRPAIFEYLFLRDEPSAAWLSCAIIVGAALLGLFGRIPERLFVGRLAGRPVVFIAVVTGVLAVSALLVYRAHALSMDEYAPLFQARVFARGALFGRAPPELVSRLVPPFRWFIEAGPDGRMVSVYWPGFALLLAPFAWMQLPWLLNPLIGGASLFLLWKIARQIWPEGAQPGWAVMFAAASPAFLVNSISYYSMPAHLLASLAFVALLLRPTGSRLLAAGAVGSLALALHNPLPHVLFALPWIAAVALRPRRLRNLALLAAGYLPGTLLLGLGWMWVRGQVSQASEISAQGVEGTLAALRNLAFAWPSLDLLWRREMNLAELANWAVPGLLVLAGAGAWQCRRHPQLRLFALSALFTFAGYLFVPYDQGHGWGYRYMHAAWAALPLLAAAAVEAANGPGTRRTMAVAAVASLVLATGLRFVQVRTFIDGHLAQLPTAARPAALEVILVRTDRGYYTQDLVQNDPFMDGKRWILFSRGPAEDARLMKAFKGARRAARTEVAELWQVD
jgi:hypothetical protein